MENVKQIASEMFFNHIDRNGLKIKDFILNSGELLIDVPEVSDALNSIIDLAIAEREKSIVEIIEEECPSNSGLTAFLHKDKIINLITNSKK